MNRQGSEACSIHTHSTLCDGRDTPQAMAAAACAAGVRYFGFSGHSHTPSPADEGCVLPAEPEEYRSTVLGLRREYEGRMEILLGLEWDSQSDCPLPDGLDYWIGSVHNLFDPESGRYYPLDWDEASLAACCIEMFQGSFPALWGQYFADVAALAAKKPTVLGHFDLITKLNGDGGIFDEESPHYRASALAALHAVSPADTLLEINTGAMARGYRRAPYPAPFLLREWRGMGGRVILTSDAHSADAVIYGYEAAAQAARDAGFTETVLLTAHGPVPCPL
jgi:histidinol phosphate phosphatase HisJ family